MKRLSVLLLVLGLAGCRHRVWTEEPTSFMGIKLGQPLSLSVPLCPKDAAWTTSKTCAESYGDGLTRLENTSGDYGIVTVGQDRSTVVRITVVFANGSYQLALNDLTKRYGPPTNVMGRFSNWVGRKVAISILEPAEGQPGMISVVLGEAQPHPPPHQNPF